MAAHTGPRIRRFLRWPDFARLAVATLVALSSAGCVVPQPRGAGSLARVVEPRTQRGYWRYLPEPYVKADDAARKSRRWPLVVTFHGMKPFDNALPQALEMEQEADRYGYIVVAPELRAPDVLAEFPVRTVHPAFKADELAVLAILDHVFSTTLADPSNVLATSWSSGGYMAHYMVNRHPTRFTCLAVRQSNFSSEVMDASKSPYSRFHPILIVNTQNDFAVCMRESAEAIRWYEDHGYTNVCWVRIKNLGHERTPDLAADFFGRVAGVTPSRPSAVLARRGVIEGNAAGIAMISGKLPELQRPPAEPEGSDAVAQFAGQTPTPPRRTSLAPDAVLTSASPWPAADGGPRVEHVPQPQPQPSAAPTPARFAPAPQPGATRPRLSVRLSSAFGIEPLYVGFSVDCPSDWLNTAQFVWLLDGKEVCSGINGQKTLNTPGTYELTVRVTTRDGQQHTASRSVRVLPRLAPGAAGADRQN